MSDLTAEIRAAIEDYHRVWPIPHDLSPNLKLASRALAELEQHRALVADLQVTRNEQITAQRDCPAGDRRRTAQLSRIAHADDLLSKHGLGDDGR